MVSRADAGGAKQDVVTGSAEAQTAAQQSDEPTSFSDWLEGRDPNRSDEESACPALPEAACVIV